MNSSIFVWRGRKEYFWQIGDARGRLEPPPLYANCFKECPFCRSKGSRYEIKDVPGYSWGTSGYCTVCGFRFERTGDIVPFFISDSQIFSVLRRFELDDLLLGIDELAAHLNRRYRDIFSLSPRRFEELVSSVYGNLCYDTRLTQQTRDGGYDVMLLEQATGHQIIVECKRYAGHRRVRVGVVRELLGVQVEQGIPEARLVTSTRFTYAAERTAAKVNEGTSGYKMKLVDSDRLAGMLGIYHADLVPLEEHERLREVDLRLQQAGSGREVETAAEPVTAEAQLPI